RSWLSSSSARALSSSADGPSATAWAATSASRWASPGWGASPSSAASRPWATTSFGAGRATGRGTSSPWPGARGGGRRRERLRAPHPGERHELLLRLPAAPRGEAARDLRALLVLPKGGRLRGRRRGRGRGGGPRRGGEGAPPPLGGPARARAGPRPRAGGGPVPDPARGPPRHRRRLPDGPRQAA